MARYHINSKGEVGICRAHKGACPFGGDDNHFPTAELARAAYEEEQGNSWGTSTEAGNTLSPASPFEADGNAHGHSSSTLSLKDLNQVIKTSSDPAVFDRMIEIGSDRTFSNFSKNPNADASHLATAYGLTEDPIVRKRLVAHKNFDLSKASPEDFADRFASSMNRFEFWDADYITDAHLDALKPTERVSFIRNPNNKVSPEYVTKLVNDSNNWLVLQAAVESGKYSIADNIDRLDSNTIRGMIDKVKDPRDLDAIAERSIREASESNADSTAEYNMWFVIRNENTRPETIERLVENTNSTDALVAAYKNPNTPTTARAKAMKKSPAVASLHTITKLDDLYGGRLDKVITKPAEEQNGRSWSGQGRVTRFDPKVVKSLGLTALDIDTFVRYHKGDYLFNAKYDEVTGVYSGYID